MPGVMRTGMVRRMHGGAPTTLEVPQTIAGLQCWLKADAIVGLVDGDPLTTWEDSHTSNNDATQATAALKPTYETLEQNGLPGVKGDGTDDFLTLAGITNNDASRTVFVVARAAATPSGLRAVWSLGGDNGARLSVDTTPVWQYRLNAASAAVNLGGTPTTTAVLTVKYTNTTTADAYRDGGAATNFDPADGYQSGTNATRLSSRAGLDYFNGYIFEFIVYDSTLSDTDRTAVRDYLNSKWAVY